MTTPAVIPSKYTDSPQAILLSKPGQGNTANEVQETVTVPDSSSVGTIIGLVAFQKGATMDYGATLSFADLDTGTTVTADWGFIYISNDTVTNINDPNAFASGATTPQAGGLLRPTATEGITFSALADGWIAVTIAGAVTKTAGDITFKGVMAYGIPT